MNYLAHLYLAEDTPESILGNFLGDFVKGTGISHYSDSIKKGIDTHRKVDAFTDLHPLFKQSKRLICDRNRRYAGVIVDIFYDHFLAKNWSEYSHVSLLEFSLKVSRIFKEHNLILPETLRSNVLSLGLEKLLMSYANIEGINKSLQKVSQRSKRETQLESSVDDLINNYEELESNFSKFFPDLVEYTYSLNC